MKTKNHKYTADGRIDMEIEHPVHGWIPFTASPDDCEELGRELYKEAKEGPIAEYVPPPIEEVLAQERSMMVITRFNLFAALQNESLLTKAKGLKLSAMSKIAWDESQSFKRTGPMIAELQKKLKLSDEQVDDIFRTEIEA